MKNLNYAFGVNKQTNSIKLYPAGHMVIAGTAGSGRSNLLNSVVNGVVSSSNPEKLQIIVHVEESVVGDYGDKHYNYLTHEDHYISDLQLWCNPNRSIPHFHLNNLIGSSTLLNKVALVDQFLHESENASDVLLVIDNFDTLSTWEQQTLFKMINDSAFLKEHLCVIASLQGSNLNVPLETFKYSVMTRAYSAEHSRKYLYTDIAYCPIYAKKYGSCFIFDTEENTLSICNVPYVPMTYYQKVTKAFSVKYHIDNPLVNCARIYLEDTQDKSV